VRALLNIVEGCDMFDSSMVRCPTSMLDSDPPDMEKLSSAVRGGVSAPELAYGFEDLRAVRTGRLNARGASETASHC
jgi:hypothetical protein